MGIPTIATTIPSTTPLQRAGRLLELYSLTRSYDKGCVGVFLQKQQVRVLAFYFLFGYSRDTRDLIRNTLQIERENLSKITSKLFKAKCLIRDIHDTRKGRLSDDLMGFKKAFDLDSGFKLSFQI